MAIGSPKNIFVPYEVFANYLEPGVDRRTGAPHGRWTNLGGDTKSHFKTDSCVILNEVKDLNSL